MKERKALCQRLAQPTVESVALYPARHPDRLVHLGLMSLGTGPGQVNPIFRMKFVDRSSAGKIIGNLYLVFVTAFHIDPNAGGRALLFRYRQGKSLSYRPIGNILSVS